MKIFAKVTREAPGFFTLSTPSGLYLSTCGSLKNCCNFQWVLGVLRDVEKESEIESEGLQKKAFFSKNAFCSCKNGKKMRVLRVLRVSRVLRVLCVLRAFNACAAFKVSDFCVDHFRFLY